MKTNRRLSKDYDYIVQNLDFKGLYTPINQVYFLKFIQYGRFIDVTNYKRIRLSYKNPNKSFVRNPDNSRTERSLQRTRENIFRLVQANVDSNSLHKPIFCTLKYKDNQTNVKIAYADFSLFIKKLRYHYHFPIKYVAVPEFQKRGAVHFHCIFFNFPFVPVKEIESLWGHGSNNQGVDFQVAKKIGSTSSYLIKYITKSYMDDRLKGVRVVLSSRNLVRPYQSFDHTILDYIINHNIIVTESVFETDYIRKLKYKIL